MFECAKRNVEPEKMLREFVEIKTSDVEEFHACMVGYEGGFEGREAGPGEVLIEFRRAALGSIEVALAFMSVAMSVHRKRQPSDSFLVQFPLVGSFEIAIGNSNYSVSEGQGFVIAPGTNVSRRSRPGWTLVFSIPVDLAKERLEYRLRRSAHRRIAFAPLITSASKEILDYGLLSVEALDRGMATRSNATGEVLAAGMMELLLDLQPHNYDDVILQSDSRQRAGRIRLVADYIDANLRTALPVAKLAEIAGCSTRTLQKALHDLHGMTPLEFVRSRRLKVARDLLQATNRKLSIVEVATQTGFTSSTRFSTYYKQAYGESPSETREKQTESPTS